MRSQGGGAGSAGPNAAELEYSRLCGAVSLQLYQGETERKTAQTTEFATATVGPGSASFFPGLRPTAATKARGKTQGSRVSGGTHQVSYVSMTKALTSAQGFSTLARKWRFQGRSLGRLTTTPNMPRSNVVGRILAQLLADG